MKMEKVNRRLASWRKELGTLAAYACAVALSTGKRSVLCCCGGCSFHLGRPPTQVTATDLLAVFEEYQPLSVQWVCSERATTQVCYGRRFVSSS